ncbi:hypothetical protein MARPO_0022s0027, partial [Marchantia polymorpha]
GCESPGRETTPARRSPAEGPQPLPYSNIATNATEKLNSNRSKTRKPSTKFSPAEDGTRPTPGTPPPAPSPLLLPSSVLASFRFQSTSPRPRPPPLQFFVPAATLPPPPHAESKPRQLVENEPREQSPAESVRSRSEREQQIRLGQVQFEPGPSKANPRTREQQESLPSTMRLFLNFPVFPSTKEALQLRSLLTAPNLSPM